MHAGTPGMEVTQIFNPRPGRGSNRGLGGRDLHHFANPSAVTYIHRYIHIYKLGGLQGEFREPGKCTISMRKWAWIGHTLRKPRENITKQDLAWTASGKRSRGRPRDEGRDGGTGMQLKETAEYGPKSCYIETNC